MKTIPLCSKPIGTTIRPWKLIGALCLVVSLVFVACDKNDPPSAPPPPADLTGFFTALPSWETFSPRLPDVNEATGEPIPAGSQTIDGDSCNCTETPYSLSTTPERVTTLNPDVEVLWVGSLLQGNGYKGGIGSLLELPIRQRAPVELSINLLAEQSSRVVQTPTVATVNQAVGELISAADADGHRAGSNIYFTSEATHSVVQAMLQMGVSASYSGATIKASLGTNLSHETRTVTAYFIQQMFTVSMVLPQHPQSVFSDAFTQAMFDQEVASGRMGPNNLPVFVSSITYGRIMMFSFTSTASEAKINQTLNVLYNGGDFGGELSSELQTVLNTAQIRVVTVGGDAEHALALIRGNNLAAFFASDAPLTTARPISYTVRNLKDNVIAHVSEATTYNLRQCVPVTLVATGARYRITMDRVQAVNLVPWYRTALLQYSLNVRDANGTHRVAYKAIGGFQPAASLREGQVHYFEGLPDPAVEVVIRFDGSNSVWIPVGSFLDWYYLNPTYTFEVGQSRTYPHQYKWPNAKMPEDDQVHTHSITRTVDIYGNQYRFYWRVQRVALLYN